MTSTVFHAESSVRKFGGKIEDYMPVHNWFDATKELFADCRHRALRHHSHGIFECERIFGAYLTNSDGRIVPVRYIGEQHVREDCGGIIPTVSDWLNRIPVESWMNRSYHTDGKNISYPVNTEADRTRAILPRHLLIRRENLLLPEDHE